MRAFQVASYEEISLIFICFYIACHKSVIFNFFPFIFCILDVYVGHWPFLTGDSLLNGAEKSLELFSEVLRWKNG